MSIDHIEILHTELPDLFDIRNVPRSPGWGVVPVPDPEYVGFDRAKADRDPGSLDDILTLEQEISRLVASSWEDSREWPEVTAYPGLTVEGPDQAWPGAPTYPHGTGPSLAPDVLAFYLPFHHYYPKWWGIYLLAEGVWWLACYLMYHMTKVQHSPITSIHATWAARLFLYYHEAFHHRAECFATRLELSDRTPLYIRRITALYRRGCKAGNCPEETVANATGIRETREKLPGVSIRKALVHYVKGCPPAWNQGNQCTGDTGFLQERSAFAETCYKACFPTRPHRNPEVWLTSPHHFHGIANVRSRVNYLIPPGSAISGRVRLRYP